MLRQGRLSIGLMVCALAFVGLSSTARADFVASSPDPVGDATDPSPARDITAMGMTYDRRAGSLYGFLRFRSYPGDAPSFITLFAGIRTAEGCNGLPAGGFGTYSDETDAGWYRLDSQTGPPAAKGEADKSGFGSKVQEFEVKSRALAGKRWNCVVATVTETGDTGIVYDTTGAIPLIGMPGLSVNIRGPKKFKRNHSQILRFTVSNPGDGVAKKVKLRLGHARGMRLSKYSKTLSSIGPGKKRTFRIRVRFNKRAHAITRVNLRGRSGQLRLKGTLSLKVRTRKPKPGDNGGGNGSIKTPRLCARYQADLSGETGGSLVLLPCYY